MKLQIPSSQTIRGHINIPGDKSVSHRALMLGAIAEGETVVRGLAPGEDVRSTLYCLRQLGVSITERNKNEFHIQGKGLAGLKPAGAILDAGNSGSTMRLLSGILAAQPFATTITGDASLRQRPMRRIIEPLTQMGAAIASQKNGCAPLTISGGRLKGIHYRLPVASAQVKSCVLFAGLGAEGETLIEEPIPTRDHSERLLQKMGARMSVFSHQYSVISIRTGTLHGSEIEVPGDSLRRRFYCRWVAFARKQLVIENVGINPTRAAFLEVLREMGAVVEILNIKMKAMNRPRIWWSGVSLCAA
jgi:3-phosphoshikimate 1-carboxyvinyltransferase